MVDRPEMLWVGVYRDQLVGSPLGAAADLIRAAGYLPFVKLRRPGVDLTPARGQNIITIWCHRGKVYRAEAG